MVKAIKNFFSALRPRSENERRDQFLGQARDLVHLEVLMKQWDRGAR